MKNAIFAAIIAGFVMTSVSFADDHAATTTTTTDHAAKTDGKMDATAPAAGEPAADHMASKKHTKMSKTTHHADGSKETTKKDVKEGAAE